MKINKLTFENRQCPLLKAIELNNKYDDAIWFIERRKEMPDDDGFWSEVYDELVKLNC